LRCHRDDVGRLQVPLDHPAPVGRRRHDGLDLPGDELSLAEPDDRGLIEIVARPRIGVAYAGAWATRPPRFSIRGNAFSRGGRKGPPPLPGSAPSGPWRGLTPRPAARGGPCPPVIARATEEAIGEALRRASVATRRKVSGRRPRGPSGRGPVVR